MLDHVCIGVRISQHPADCPRDFRAVVRMVSRLDRGWCFGVEPPAKAVTKLPLHPKSKTIPHRV